MSAKVNPAVDALGVTHERASGESRIVSLVPSITELLFALDLGPRVVGRTSFCVHPVPEVGEVPRVGGTKTVKIDKLRALAPTHVIVNVDENRREDVEEMSEFVPSVIVTHPIEPEDNLHLFALLGHVFDRSGQARALAGRFSRAYEEVVSAADRLPRRNVCYLIWRSPWMSISKPTYIAKMLALVNLRTPYDDARGRYPEVCVAAECAAGIDAFLFSTEPFPFKEKHLVAFRREQPCERQTLSLIDGQMTSWYGSRAIRGLGYLRRFATELTRAESA